MKRPATPRAHQPRPATDPARAAGRQAAPPVYRPCPTPLVLQPKTAPQMKPRPAAGGEARKTPAAPPVYRPQPRPASVQAKAAIPPASAAPPNAAAKRPAAPAAYRPQPVPKVLQKKSALVQPPHTAQPPRQPVAPPVFRPRSTPGALQAKRPVSAAPAVPRVTPAAAGTGGNAPAPPQQRRGPVIQRLKWDEAMSGLHKSEMVDFNAWLNARSLGVGPGKHQSEQYGQQLVLHYVKDIQELRNRIAVFKKYSTAPPSKKGGVAEKLHDILLSSATIREFSATRPGVKEIEGSIRVLDDSAFTNAYGQSFEAQNSHLNLKPENMWEQKLVKFANIEGVLGFEMGGKIHLRQGFVDDHLAIHELIHKLAAPNFPLLLGKVINEGLTEMIAKEVCESYGLQELDIYYKDERELVVKIAKDLHLNETDLKEAYFKKPENIVTALKARLGKDGYEEFRQKKTASDADMVYTMKGLNTLLDDDVDEYLKFGVQVRDMVRRTEELVETWPKTFNFRFKNSKK